MDSFEKRIRVLFSQCRRGGAEAAGQSEGEFLAIRKDYYKALEDADEKVHLANQMYDLVDRYLRRLDSELFKFKCELEADHNGITEILEKRSLELDGGGSSSSAIHGVSQKENRYFGLISSNNYVQQQQQLVPMLQQQPAPPPPALQSGGGRERYASRPKPEKRRDSSTSSGGPMEKRQAVNSVVVGNNLGNSIVTSATALIRPTTPTVVLAAAVNAPPTVAAAISSAGPPPVSYSLQHIGAGNAIAAAASQAIAATQQMQQGRRTASLKASYEAIHGSAGNGAHELLIGRELTTGQGPIQADAAAATTNFQNHRRHKKYTSLSFN